MLEKSELCASLIGRGARPYADEMRQASSDGCVSVGDLSFLVCFPYLSTGKRAQVRNNNLFCNSATNFANVPELADMRTEADLFSACCYICVLIGLSFR